MVKQRLKRLTSTAKAQIGTIEARVRKQISEYVVTLALKRVTLQLGKLIQTYNNKFLIEIFRIRRLTYVDCCNKVAGSHTLTHF